MGCGVRILVVSTLAAALATSLPAQRGGFAGGHGGTGRGAILPSSTAIGAGALTRGPSSVARSTMPARAPGYRGSGVANRGRVGVYRRDYRHLPFAYWAAPYYYPVLDYGDTGYSGNKPDYYDTGDDPSSQAAMMAQNALMEQVQRLSAQVAQLQNGQPAQPQSNTQQQEPPQVPVTLVLRNGQQLQVQNYAVMDQTFWDLSRQPVRKIPIASIDVAASAKATEASGGDFPALGATQ